jgi:hypothetical protein
MVLDLLSLLLLRAPALVPVAVQPVVEVMVVLPLVVLVQVLVPARPVVAVLEV